MKKFHILFFAFLFIASISSVFAQKCKTEKDPFTSEKVVSADESNKYTKTRFIYLENKSGKTRFELLWSYPGSFNTVISKGAEILFKLKDGEVIKLNTVADAQPKFAAGYMTVFTSYTFEMELEKVTLNKLALAKIILMRVPDLKAGSPDISKKDANGAYYFKVINKGAKYLMKNI